MLAIPPSLPRLLALPYSLCQALLCSVLVLSAVRAETFEPEAGFEKGLDVEMVTGWTGSETGMGIVSDREASQGKQSLEIRAGISDGYVTRSFTPAADGVTFIDFQILSHADDSEEPLASVDVDGAVLAFLRKTKHEGEIVAVGKDEMGADLAVETKFVFPTKRNGRSKEWIRLTVRQDRNHGMWDLFINGEMILADQRIDAAGHSVPAIRFYSAADTAYVDDLEVAATNMLFKDSDKDGFSDIYEIAHGMDPYRNDRLADRDLDGISNLVEFLAGTRPDISGQTSSRIIYVDNSVGNHSNSGHFHDVSAGVQGPKRSIKDAMRRAHDGDVIMILKGRGTYHEGPDKMQGGNITLRFENPQTVISHK